MPPRPRRLAIGFTSKLLLDALDILDTDREVALGFTNEVSPVTIRRRLIRLQSRQCGCPH